MACYLKGHMQSQMIRLPLSTISTFIKKRKEKEWINGIGRGRWDE